MDIRSKLGIDMNKFSNLTQQLPKGATVMLNQLSKQLNDYEKKVKQFVRGVDLKSREAREKSKVQINQLLNQVQKTRVTIESRVSSVVNQEAKRLNSRVNEVLKYLVSAAKKENHAKTTKKTKSPSTSKRKKTTKKKTSAH